MGDYVYSKYGMIFFSGCLSVKISSLVSPRYRSDIAALHSGSFGGVNVAEL